MATTMASVSPPGSPTSFTETFDDPLKLLAEEGIRILDPTEIEGDLYEEDDDDSEEDDYLAALITGAAAQSRRTTRPTSSSTESSAERTTNSHDPLTALAETMNALRVGGDGRPATAVVLDNNPSPANMPASEDYFGSATSTVGGTPGAVDDSVRMWLREIGKTHLLTTDQEVRLPNGSSAGMSMRSVSSPRQTCVLSSPSPSGIADAACPSPI